MKGLATFLAGAAVGAVVAALLTPTTGEDLRARIKMMLQKKASSQPMTSTNLSTSLPPR